MKEEKTLKDKLKLLEKEIATLTDQVERTHKQLTELSDVKDEIKGLKLFLGRSHPEFKRWFPGIMQKIYKKN